MLNRKTRTYFFYSVRLIKASYLRFSFKAGRVSRTRVLICCISSTAVVIYTGIKMPIRDSMEVELQSRQKETRAYPRVSSTRIERSATSRCSRRVVRHDRVIGEKVKKTRANWPAIYLDWSHAQPSVNTSREREREKNKKRERKESRAKMQTRLARVNTC